MGSTHIDITVYSHHFCCLARSARGIEVCTEFSKQYIQFGLVKRRGRFYKEAIRVFASRTDDRYEFRFHINSLKDFKRHLENSNINDKLYSITEVPVPEADDVILKIRDGWILRENQLGANKYLTDKNQKNKLLTLQTGKGKGFVSMKACSEIGKRVVIIIRPMFINKWIIELQEVLDITSDNIITAEGGRELKALLSLAKQGGLKEEIVIISNKTIQNWYKDYKTHRRDTLDMGYDCYPHELFSLLRAGVRVIDEVHMDIHLQCLIDLHSHVADSISLSATMVNRDPFIKRMQDMMYPVKDRYDAGELDKYIRTFGITYNVFDLNKIRTSQRGRTSYSHTAYETSIMRDKKMMGNYMNLIDNSVKTFFLTVKRPVKRLLIFADLVDMCTEIVKYLKSKHPNVDIRRFCQGDPDENLLEPEIIVSTLMSCGTARDIPDLTTVLMTTTVDSLQTNIQALGRLRKLKDEFPVEFYWFTCTGIQKHNEYHDKRVELMKERAASYNLIPSGSFI